MRNDGTNVGASGKLHKFAPGVASAFCVHFGSGAGFPKNIGFETVTQVRFSGRSPLLLCPILKGLNKRKDFQQ
jgi:hypothetical protein